jgi:chromodomain-helicase-DNA-binding protein 4
MYETALQNTSLRIQGKTVQIVTFVGQIVAGIKQSYSACPVLVVVPNSTITNWVREFERWAPNLRVVPFYGESKSRDIIKQYELYHEIAPKRATKAKYHVLVTTYETITNARESMPVFKSTPRWEALVVDEGQRCAFSLNYIHVAIFYSANSEKR